MSKLRTPTTVAHVAHNSYLALLVAKRRHVLQMLSSDTRAMGRFLYVTRCDLTDTFATGRLHFYINYNADLTPAYNYWEVALWPIYRGA